MWDLVGNPEDRFSHNETRYIDLCSAKAQIGLGIPAKELSFQ